MAEHNDRAIGRQGWLPLDVWAKILDEHAPIVPLNTIMDITPEEAGDAFEPSILSQISCVHFDGQLMRFALAGVNKQLRAFLHGTYLLPHDCLVVTNGNARRLHECLESAASAEAPRPSARHVAFILHLTPGAGRALDDFAHILRLVEGIQILSFGAVYYSGADSHIDVELSNITHFTGNLRYRNTSLMRIAFLDGADILSAAWDSEGTEPHGWGVIRRCENLRTLSFHRNFQHAGPALTGMASLRHMPDLLHILAPQHTLRYLIVDSPTVRYRDSQLRCTRVHYIRDGNSMEGFPSFINFFNFANGVNEERSPVSHISMVMATRPRNIDSDFRNFSQYAPFLHHLLLSGPLSQLTSSVSMTPLTVRTLVLVVDNSVSWNTQLPPPETVAWERLHKLLVAVAKAKSGNAIHLERVQFLQAALARRIRSELEVHEDVKQVLAATGVAFLNDRNEPL